MGTRHAGVGRTPDHFHLRHTGSLARWRAETSVMWSLGVVQRERRCEQRWGRVRVDALGKFIERRAGPKLEGKDVEMI